MRVHLSLLGLGLMMLLGGCDQAVATGPGTSTSPSPSPSPSARLPRPAADAGGACMLLDYKMIEDALALRFDVAAAGRQGKTYTCVARSSEAGLPDLVFTMSTTKADASVFRSDMVPESARQVKSLGKAAYRSTTKAAKGGGPAAEVGWLADDKKLLTLRLTLSPGSPQTAAEWHSIRLTTLAKNIENSRG